MAGFWHLSHHQMRDLNGNAYAGAKAYFYEADTSNPLVVYQDYGLGTQHANPVVANAYGIFPPVFFDEADSFFRQRITTSGGAIIPDTDLGTMPIIGPTGGGGGSEVPVDENALAKTGDIKARYGTGALAGWVRVNGRTIGSAVSGATERANADCENLFLHLWTNDANLSVSGGRGASSAADWAANKTIAMPDARGRAIVGLDDMGSTAAGRLTSSYFGTSAIVLGAAGGSESHTITSAQMPSHTHTATTNITDPGHNHAIFPDVYGTSIGHGNYVQPASNFYSAAYSANTSSKTTGITAATSNANTGGGTAHNNVQPSMIVTIYMRL